MDNSKKWATSRSCKFKINYHLVFVTKYRRNILSDKILIRMEQIFDEICKQMEVELLEFNGENYYVHIMTTLPPKVALSNLVGKLKEKSSYYIRKEFWSIIKQKLWGKHFWSPSYCAVSCGGAPLAIVKEYIKNQQRPAPDRPKD